MPPGRSATRRPTRGPGPRCRAPAAAAGRPGRDRRWNPRATGARPHPECARCRRRAPHSDRSNTAPRRCGRASADRLLLLLLLTLLLGLLFAGLLSVLRLLLRLFLRRR